MNHYLVTPFLLIAACHDDGRIAHVESAPATPRICQTVIEDRATPHTEADAGFELDAADCPPLVCPGCQACPVCEADAGEPPPRVGLWIPGVLFDIDGLPQCIFDLSYDVMAIDAFCEDCKPDGWRCEIFGLDFNPHTAWPAVPDCKKTDLWCQHRRSHGPRR